MKEPLVSIIIPIYNGELFLDKCIESIRSQTIKEIEIILLNDGSTDHSGQMCDNYSKEDTRIKVIHKENEGLAETRNKGIKEASAPFIFFLDCDDWIEGNSLELLLNVQNREKADIVLGIFIIHHENKIKHDNKDKTRTYNVLDRREAVSLILLDKRITSYVCGNLYRKELFNGVKFPSNRAYEDYATSYRIFLNADKIIETNYAIYHYVQHSESIIHTPNPINEYHFFIAELERYHFVKENPFYFDDMKIYNIHAAKTVLRLLKRVLLLTEKGDMEDEILQMQEFLKSLYDINHHDIGIGRYIKMQLSIHSIESYRKFLKATKKRDKVYKTKL